MKLHVNLGKNSYDIYMKEGVLAETPELIRSIFKGKQVVILSDDNVYPLYGTALQESIQLGGFECHSIVLPHGESSKNIDGLPAIYGRLAALKISRSDLIIALGGGVIGDLAGFVASTYLRGIAFVQIPTSLLAQVDSSVGGKVAVDLKEGKNLVGSFYQPQLVLIDPLVLRTLPERYISDGMAEVIKYGCIKDSHLFDMLSVCNSFLDLRDTLLSDLIDQMRASSHPYDIDVCLDHFKSQKQPKVLDYVLYRCVDIKRLIVEQDQYDMGERMLLNFGHTIGHALEQLYQYERESHGEAVAIGMYQLTQLAEDKGLTKRGTAEQILNLITRYQLPSKAQVATQDLLEAMSVDKKNLGGKLNLILLNEIGDSYIYPTDLSFFDQSVSI